MIYQLPPKYALILRGGLSPVIAHAPIGWHDRGYLLARIRSRAVAPVRPSQAEVAAPHQAVPPVDRWAPVDHTRAAHGPADAVRPGAAAAGAGGRGTTGDRAGRRAGRPLDALATEDQRRAADPFGALTAALVASMPSIWSWPARRSPRTGPNWPSSGPPWRPCWA